MARIRVRLTAHVLVLNDAIFHVISFERPTKIGQTPRNIPDPLEGASHHSKYVQTEIGLEADMIGKLIPHCSSVIDADGQVLYLSPSWFLFTGLSREQSLGNKWAG